MKPPPFEYIRARSVEEAIELLDRFEGDAKLLAGGQSLLPVLNFRLLRPAALVDIRSIDGLSGLDLEGDTVRIGALARHRTLEVSPLIQERLPIFAEAARHIGHLAIRNRGTFGGSLAHADPSAEWPLLALLHDASARVHGPNGERTIPASELFADGMGTVLAEAEVLTYVDVPVLPVDAGWSFIEVARRHGDFALVAVAVSLTQRGGTIEEGRIAIGGADVRAVRSARAETELLGRRLSSDLFERAAESAAADVDPTDDIHGSADFRRHLVRVLTSRALHQANARAAGGAI